LQSVHQVKQAKKNDADCTVRTADVAGPYRPYDDVASDDVAESGWLLKVNDVSTRGSFLVNDWVPRGPIMGCHVAPRNWLIGCV
jgi:hypothetical protein